MAAALCCGSVGQTDLFRFRCVSSCVLCLCAHVGLCVVHLGLVWCSRANTILGCDEGILSCVCNMWLLLSVRCGELACVWLYSVHEWLCAVLYCVGELACMVVCCSPLSIRMCLFCQRQLCGCTVFSGCMGGHTIYSIIPPFRAPAATKRPRTSDQDSANNFCSEKEMNLSATRLSKLRAQCLGFNAEDGTVMVTLLLLEEISMVGANLFWAIHCRLCQALERHDYHALENIFARENADRMARISADRTTKRHAARRESCSTCPSKVRANRRGDLCRRCPRR